MNICTFCFVNQKLSQDLNKKFFQKKELPPEALFFYIWIYTVRNSYRPKAFADDFARVRDKHERFRVDRFDVLAQSDRFAAAAGHEDHLSVLVRIGADRIDHGGAPVHLPDDVIADCIGAGGDDRKVFAQVDALDHGIHDKRLDDQAEQRKQAGADIEDEAGGERDQRIADQQRLADIEARILFEDHGDDVRSAGGGVAVEQDRRAHRREHHRKAELQKRLVCKRRRHRVDHFKKPGQKGIQHAAVRRHQAEAAPEKQEADQKQDQVDHPHRNRRRKERHELAEQDGNTADAAGGEVVRKLEKIDADRREDRAECNQKKILDFRLADLLYWVLHCRNAPVFSGMHPLYFNR